MPFVEQHPAVVSPNPGGSDDPLGESVMDVAAPGLRVFEPSSIRLVLGRHQDPHRELLIAHACRDGVPIHRRVTGGGAVVLAPGMLVVALRMARQGGVEVCFSAVNRALSQALDPLLAGACCCTRGHGDLAIEPLSGSAPTRKICGASLRQTRSFACYLGVLLVADAVPLMERYLASPSRQPDYRQDRSHRAFCTCLSDWGVKLAMARDRIRAACQPLSLA